MSIQPRLASTAQQLTAQSAAMPQPALHASQAHSSTMESAHSVESDAFLAQATPHAAHALILTTSITEPARRTLSPTVLLPNQSTFARLAQQDSTTTLTA